MILQKKNKLYILPFIWLLAATMAQLMRAVPLSNNSRYLILMFFLFLLALIRGYHRHDVSLPYKTYGNDIGWLSFLLVIMSIIPLYKGFIFQNLELKLAIKWILLLFTIPAVFRRYRPLPNETVFILIALALLAYFILVPSAYKESVDYHEFVFERSAELNRFQGIFGNPIILASYAFVLTTFSIALVSQRSSALAKLLLILVLLEAGYIYFRTINRQNLLFIISHIVQLVIVQCLIRTRRNKWIITGKRSFIATVFFAIILLSVSGFLIGTDNRLVKRQMGFWKDRFNTVDQQISTESGRMVTIKNGLYIIAQNPVLGTGYGMVKVALNSAGMRVSSVHNTPIQLLASGGLFAGLLWYILLFLKIPLCLYRSKNKENSGLVFLTGYACIFIQTIYESVLHKEHFFLYISLWALYTAMMNSRYSLSVRQKGNTCLS